MNVPTIKIEQPVITPPAVTTSATPAVMNHSTVEVNASLSHAITSPNKPRRHPAFYVPANWNSEAHNDTFVFINNTTGDEFKGTPKEFSRMLREE